MLTLTVRRVQLHFSFWFFAVLALFLLWERGMPALYLLLPVAVHECGHLLAMLLCGAQVASIRFSAIGIAICRQPGDGLSYPREMAISLAGAAANGLLALALHLFCFRSMRTMLMTASNLAVALFNLAPIGDLDGGQVIQLLVARFLPPHTGRLLSRIASFLVLGILFGLAIFLLLIRWYNFTLLAICVYLLIHAIREG